MTYRIDVNKVDIDGAIRETAEEAAGHTRLSFLKKGGMAGGALMSGGAILSALAPTAFGDELPGHINGFGHGDVAILNFALALEYLESAFYNGASAANLALSPQAAAFLNVVTRDEKAHVEFLKAALGSKAIAEPTFDFKGTNTSPQLFMETSFVLENTGVHAYLGQIARIASHAYLKAAGSIVTIEGRHAGVIGLLLEGSEPGNGDKITPSGPFDTPLKASEVLAAVKATGFIVEGEQTSGY